GDIGDRELFAADEFVRSEARVECLEELPDPSAPALDERGNLLVIVRARQRASLEGRRRIAQRLRHREEPVALDLPLPGGNSGAAEWATPHQRGFRLQYLEVDADRHDVGEARTVIELEDRHGAIRIDGAEFGSELRVGAQIDLYCGNDDALLG